MLRPWKHHCSIVTVSLRGFLWGSACCQHFALTLLTDNSSCGSIFSSLVCFNSSEKHRTQLTFMPTLPLQRIPQGFINFSSKPQRPLLLFWGKALPDSTQKPRMANWIKKTEKYSHYRDLRKTVYDQLTWYWVRYSYPDKEIMAVMDSEVRSSPQASINI